MELNEIVKIIDNENVRFNFYPHENLYNNNYILYIDVLSFKERKIYEEKNEEEQKEYISTSAMICIPDIDSERLGSIYKNNDSSSYDFTLKNIRKIVNISKGKENLAFSLYLILHEIGHWIHFDEMGRKPYNYAKEDKDIRLEIFNKQQKLQEELSMKMICGELTKKDKMDMKNCIIDYHNIPMEKRADEYANKNFKKIWVKLQ